jgi:ABC-type lipoprotein release transport system permease subunit
MNRVKLPSMAWLNLWRHRRRTLLTISSIAFGVMLAILFTGIGDSNWRDMIDLAARMGGGHVSLQHREFLDSPILKNSINSGSALRARAFADPDVERVVARIAGQILLSTAGQSYGAGFIAFDPADEDVTTLSLLEAIDEGQIFATSREPGIILGRQLAKNLNARLGSKIIYTLTDEDGEIVYGVTRLSGIATTGAPTVDAGLCLLPIDSVREALGMEEDAATQLALFLTDQRDADAVAGRLVDPGPGLVALPWHRSQPELAGFIAMKVAGAQVMETIIMVLVAAGIFNTLFVSVMERIREFGIMLAIGFTPAMLFALVMLESLWLGLIGLVAAALVTAGPYYYLATTGVDISEQLDISGSEVAGVALSSVMRVDIYPENAAMIAAAALIATLLSGLYPAWQAGRVDPVESIRLV